MGRLGQSREEEQHRQESVLGGASTISNVPFNILIHYEVPTLMTLINPNHFQNVLSQNTIPYLQYINKWKRVKFKP